LRLKKQPKRLVRESFSIAAFRPYNANDSRSKLNMLVLVILEALPDYTA